MDWLRIILFMYCLLAAIFITVGLPIMIAIYTNILFGILSIPISIGIGMKLTELSIDILL